MLIFDLANAVSCYQAVYYNEFHIQCLLPVTIPNNSVRNISFEFKITNMQEQIYRSTYLKFTQRWNTVRKL
jgi:hypothetical protein